MSTEYSEYLRDNSGLITGIAGSIDRVIESDPDHQVFEQTPPGDSVITAGVFTAKQMMESAAMAGEVIDPEDAQVRADIKNRLELSAFDSRVKTLRGLVAMHAVTSGQSPDVAPSNLPMPYVSAKKRQSTLTTVTGSIALTSTILTNVGDYEHAHMHTMLTSDGGVRDLLTLVFVDDTPIQAQSDTQQEEDPLMRQVVTLLMQDTRVPIEDAIVPLIPIINGSYRSEAEISQKLGELRERYAGTPIEQPLSPIIGEIHKRAVAARDSRIMRIDFGLSEPTFDQLQETQRMLAGLLGE